MIYDSVFLALEKETKLIECNFEADEKPATFSDFSSEKFEKFRVVLIVER